MTSLFHSIITPLYSREGQSIDLEIQKCYNHHQGSPRKHWIFKVHFCNAPAFTGEGKLQTAAKSFTCSSEATSNDHALPPSHGSVGVPSLGEGHRELGRDQAIRNMDKLHAHAVKGIHTLLQRLVFVV